MPDTTATRAADQPLDHLLMSLSLLLTGAKPEEEVRRSISRIKERFNPLRGDDLFDTLIAVFGEPARELRGSTMEPRINETVATVRQLAFRKRLTRRGTPLPVRYADLLFNEGFCKFLDQGMASQQALGLCEIAAAMLHEGRRLAEAFEWLLEEPLTPGFRAELDSLEAELVLAAYSPGSPYGTGKQ